MSDYQQKFWTEEDKKTVRQKTTGGNLNKKPTWTSGERGTQWTQLSLTRSDLYIMWPNLLSLSQTMDTLLLKHSRRMRDVALTLRWWWWWRWRSWIKKLPLQQHRQTAKWLLPNTDTKAMCKEFHCQNILGYGPTLVGHFLKTTLCR